MLLSRDEGTCWPSSHRGIFLNPLRRDWERRGGYDRALPPRASPVYSPFQPSKPRPDGYIEGTKIYSAKGQWMFLWNSVLTVVSRTIWTIINQQGSQNSIFRCINTLYRNVEFVFVCRTYKIYNTCLKCVIIYNKSSNFLTGSFTSSFAWELIEKYKWNELCECNVINISY